MQDLLRVSSCFRAFVVPAASEERRLRLGAPAALVIDQPRLAVEAAAVAGQRSARSNHAMTRDDDRNRVGAVRGADRPGRAGRAERARSRRRLSIDDIVRRKPPIEAAFRRESRSRRRPRPATVVNSRARIPSSDASASMSPSGVGSTVRYSLRICRQYRRTSGPRL